MRLQYPPLFPICMGRLEAFGIRGQDPALLVYPTKKTPSMRALIVTSGDSLESREALPTPKEDSIH